MPFIATMTYELHRETDPDAAKLLRAELVGRRWQDRYEGEKLPATMLWMPRHGDAELNVDQIQARCAEELFRAVAAVAAMGRKIMLLRVWVQVTAAGAFGLVAVPRGAAAS
jgi:hypothetical protein